MKGKIQIEDSEARKKLLKYLEETLQFNACENDNVIEIESKPIKYLNIVEIASRGNLCKEFTYKSFFQDEGIRLTQKDKQKIIEKINSSKLPTKNFFEFVGRAIVFFSNQELPKIFSEVITPAFQKRFPDGSIHLLQIDNLLAGREAYTRLVMANKELPEVLNFNSKKEFKGFQSLRALQSTLALGTINAYLPLVLLGFRPNANGIFIAKVSGLFVFLFGKQIESREPYPPTFLAHFVPQDFLDLYTGHPREMYKLTKDAKWTPEQYKKLFYDYIERVNKLLDHFYNISNFTDPGGYIDGLKAFNGIYTINRIAAETTLMITEYHAPLASTILSFAILDKISNLIKLFKPTLDEVEIFKDLVCKNKMLKLQKLFSDYPPPFDNYLRNRFKQAFSDFNKNIIDSIFLKERISDDEIVVDPTKPSGRLTKDQYIVEFVRALRNTHHGYGIKPNQLKKLIISNGSIGNEIELITFFLVFMLITNPQEFIGYW
jgi:hypothetical protein